MRQHKHEGCSVREHRNTCAKRSTRAQRAKACKPDSPREGIRETQLTAAPQRRNKPHKSPTQRLSTDLRLRRARSATATES